MTTNEMKIAMADGDAMAVPQENLYQQAVKMNGTSIALPALSAKLITRRTLWRNHYPRSS